MATNTQLACHCCTAKGCVSVGMLHAASGWSLEHGQGAAGSNQPISACLQGNAQLTAIKHQLIQLDAA